MVFLCPRVGRLFEAFSPVDLWSPHGVPNPVGQTFPFSKDLCYVPELPYLISLLLRSRGHGEPICTLVPCVAKFVILNFGKERHRARIVSAPLCK